MDILATAPTAQPAPTIYACFSQSRGLGDLIRRFTGGDVNHAFLKWLDPTFGTWLTLGANANGLTIETLSKFPDKIMHVYEFPSPGLVKGLRAKANLLNSPYDYAGLIGMSLVEINDHLLERMVANPTLDYHKLFCSEYVTEVIRASGINILPKWLPGSVDPAALCQACAELAKEVTV